MHVAQENFLSLMRTIVKDDDSDDWKIPMLWRGRHGWLLARSKAGNGRLAVTDHATRSSFRSDNDSCSVRKGTLRKMASVDRTNRSPANILWACGYVSGSNIVREELVSVK